MQPEPYGREQGHGVLAILGRLVISSLLVLAASLVIQMLMVRLCDMPKRTGLGLIASSSFALATLGLMAVGANRMRPLSCLALSVILLIARIFAGTPQGTLPDIPHSLILLFASYFLGGAVGAWLSRTRWLRTVLALYAGALLLAYILPPISEILRSGKLASFTFIPGVPVEACEAWRLEERELSVFGMQLLDLTLLSIVLLLASDWKISRRTITVGMVAAITAVGILTAVSGAPVPASPWVVATLFAARAVSSTIETAGGPGETISPVRNT